MEEGNKGLKRCKKILFQILARKEGENLCKVALIYFYSTQIVPTLTAGHVIVAFKMHLVLFTKLRDNILW